MADKEEYTLGEGITAKEVYGKLKGPRQPVIDMGRRMAELTIPTIFPPEGYKTGDDLPGNNQSIGARCVSNLGSALMFMAFPPGQPIARIEAIEYAVQAEVDKDPELWNRMLLALSRLEMSHRKRLQTTTIADAYNRYLEVLLVAGNCLWKQMDLDAPTYHLPDRYVVKRDKAGQTLLIIHEEKVALEAMDKDLANYIRSSKPDEFKDKTAWEQEVCIYSVQKLKVDASGEKSWCYWEEWEGERLEDTDVETDFEHPPMHAGWLIPMYGQDWGPGYCERYRGDLFCVEAGASALTDGTALMALALLFVKPGSGASLRQIREAKNLSTLPGSADDLTVFRSDKSADFNFVLNYLERAERRLEAAFLLQSAVQRSGERVTAEEIRRLGTELDKALGGLYTQIAQANQRPIILRAMRLNEEENPKLPTLPKGLIEVQVVTGTDALGQSQEADSLMEYAQAGKVAFPESFEALHDGLGFFNRLAAAKGIKPDGLVKSKEAVSKEQQSQAAMATQRQLLDKGTTPAVKAAADAMAARVQPGQSNPQPSVS